MTDYYDDSIYEQPETPRQEQEASHQEPEQSMPQMPHTPKKEKKNGKGAVALVLCCALVGGGCGIGGAFIGNSLANKNQPTTVYSDGVSTIMKGVRETSTLQVQQIDSSKVLTGAEVYAANVNSTVGIVTSLVTTNFWGQQTTGAAAGSGFIFSDDGYILTNYHVVKGATSITVSTYDGTKYDAQLIGYDESNDVAVLKIDATGLTPAVIGDSDKLAVGETTVAVGNPLGTLSNTVTQGIVSALNRQVTVEDNDMTLIQTDTSISPGNSGGGLFNANGELIGVVNAKSSYSEAEGIGFAIPINTAMDIAQQLIENGAVARPVLGVSILDIQDSSTAQQYGVSALGVYVADVTKGGGAEAAGVQRGDRIIAIDDTAVSSTSTVKSYLADKQVGDTVTLQVERDGKVLTLNVTLGNSAQ